MKLDLTFGVGRFLVLVAATLIAVFQNPEVIAPATACYSWWSVWFGDQLSPMHPFHLCLKYKFDKGCREDNQSQAITLFSAQDLSALDVHANACSLVLNLLFTTRHIRFSWYAAQKNTKPFCVLYWWISDYHLFQRINQCIEGNRCAWCWTVRP